MSLQDRVLLGVAENASWREIKIAFRNICRVMHPDVGGNPAEFTRLTCAYSRLEAALAGPQPCEKCNGTGRVMDGPLLKIFCKECGGSGVEE
jgi:DnaJ-class molecular chaperone